MFENNYTSTSHFTSQPKVSEINNFPANKHDIKLL